MESRKEMTKTLLGASFRELMEAKPFDKITIKMITDRAGVIRPTFYNYFQDKYELIEWLLDEMVFDTMRDLLSHDMGEEAVKMLLVSLEKDWTYYSRAFAVTGQNSFEHIFKEKLYRLFLEGLEAHHVEVDKSIRLLTKENIALYYANDLVDIVRFWIQQGDSGITAEEIMEGYLYILTHPLFDLVRN